ncbi:hypothetical protein BBO_00727 [Beauveria brongniartii RCEF 3172]|uniref:Uncharacterized protein n=1 Tax=Beauveria brongniartii RCEF 3172 TaxID=1081107 RepID=A0A162M4W3_9HYPO|nr:hypothetical protein BBO_00727 [Beauveria brongniartii RCEF 3172]
MKLAHSLALCFVSLALAAPHGNGSPGEEAMVVTWADVQKRHGHDVAVDKRAEEAMVVTWADVQKRHGHDAAVDKRDEEAMVVTWADVQKV